MSQTRKNQRGGSNSDQRSVQETPILNNVLGITAAVGYNKNVLGTGSALSARSRSNYLTNTLRKKKFKNYFQGIEPRNWLEYAVDRQDDLAVKMLLEHPPKQVQRILKNPAVFLRRLYGIQKQNLVERVLIWLSNASRLNNLYTKQSQTKMLNILVTFLKHGGLIEKHLVQTVWNLSPDVTNKILDASPTFKQDSIQQGETLLKEMRDDVNYLASEIKRLEFEVRYGRGGMANRSDLRDNNAELKRRERSLANLEAFLEKERPELFMEGVILNNNTNYNNNYINNTNNYRNENNYSNSMRQMYGNTNNENNNYGNAMRQMYANTNNNA